MEDLDADEDGLCYVCEKTHEDGLTLHRGHKCGKPCIAAVRAYGRTLKDNPKSKEEMERLFHNEPKEWRKRIMPFTVPGGRSTARNNAKRAHDEYDTDFRREQERQARNSIQLTKCRYKNYKKMGQYRFHGCIRGVGHIVCTAAEAL